MSVLAGYVGPGSPRELRLLLGAVPGRGDRVEVAVFPGGAMGVATPRRLLGARSLTRAEDGRVVALAGTVVDAEEGDAAAFLTAVGAGGGRGRAGPDGAGLDGAFAAAVWSPVEAELTLWRDPFGARGLVWVEHRGALWFASEVKQLLALPGLPVAVDAAAIHAYLAFSCIPGPRTGIAGVHALPPGHRLTVRDGRRAAAAYFELPTVGEGGASVPEADLPGRIDSLGRAAVRRRFPRDRAVGIALSGGLDSSAVAAWAVAEGAKVEAYHLDFGPDGVDRDAADAVAAALGLRLRLVRVDATRVRDALPGLVSSLDQPFGDAVTGPHRLLAEAAAGRGTGVLLNGEGGDQLFGGWGTKPMVAAALYGEQEPIEEQYLRSYHRFHGLEGELYTPAFRALVGVGGARSGVLAPLLRGTGPLLDRVRRADVGLKGSFNVLPRVEKAAGAFGIEARSPLFDRTFATVAFALPPDTKLRGADDKHVLKQAVAARLPAAVVGRRKTGMAVPVTDWLLGPAKAPGKTPLTEVLDDALGERAVRARGMFEPAYVARLRAGVDEPGVARRRRVGEKLWALLMLELWMRAFVDRRGGAP